MKKIKIAHLYPKLLSGNGDAGNILALKKRCEWRGFEVIVNEINLGDSISEHDLYFLGGGQETQKVEAANELKKHKDFFQTECNDMAVFFAVAEGYHILGNSFQVSNGDILEGLELLNTFTTISDKRFTGNVTLSCDLVEPNTLVGFENHNELTFIQGDTEPLAKVMIGKGNNGQDMTEGACFKNVFGTNLYGSFLPKNPHFTDYLLELALGFKPETLEDDIEMAAHKSLLGKNY